MAEGQGSRENEESGQPPNSANGIAQNGDISLDLMVDAYAQEYQNLDKTMDEIDSWMTKLEQQNDSLNAQLDDLLESSRQARKELQEQNSNQAENNTAMENSDNDSQQVKENNTAMENSDNDSQQVKENHTAMGSSDNDPQQVKENNTAVGSSDNDSQQYIESNTTIESSGSNPQNDKENGAAMETSEREKD